MDDLVRIGKGYIAETFIGLKLYEFVSTKVPLYWAVIIGYGFFVAVRWIKERRKPSASEASHSIQAKDKPVEN